MEQIKNYASKDTQLMVIGNKADLTGTQYRVEFVDAMD